MASLAAIRAAVKTTLETAITSLTVYDTVPDATNLPAVIVEPAEADFVVAMGRGVDTYQLRLYVLCSLGISGLGQNALDDYVTGAGSNSIRAAIFATRNLGLAGIDAHVTGMSGYGGTFDSAAIEHVGAIVHMTVHTPGTA